MGGLFREFMTELREWADGFSVAQLDAAIHYLDAVRARKRAEEGAVDSPATITIAPDGISSREAVGTPGT